MPCGKTVEFYAARFGTGKDGRRLIRGAAGSVEVARPRPEA